MNNFLNAYQITNGSDLQWNMVLYKVKKVGAQQPKRGAVKHAMWEARRKFRKECVGQPIVIDLDESTVAVPAEWMIPSGSIVDNFLFERGEELIVSYGREGRQRIFSRIINDGIRRHFRANQAPDLGLLWQDFNSFCQIPNSRTESGFAFCRRFDCDAKEFLDGWAIRFAISTACIDGNSISDYYKNGNVRKLAQMVEAKLSQETRSDEEPSIRILHRSKSGETLVVGTSSIFDPQKILNDARLSRVDQQQRADLPLDCIDFRDEQKQFDPHNCFLIVDSQIASSDHDETIIDPDERMKYTTSLRNFVNRCEIFGVQLSLAEKPADNSCYNPTIICPPAIYVKGSNGDFDLIEAPERPDADLLWQRARERDEHIRRFGFYQTRPINPLIAVPVSCQNLASPLRTELNRLLQERNVDYRFPSAHLFNKVTSIDEAVRQHRYDAVLAVLPEHSAAPRHKNDTHEQIKRLLNVPSQCICHNTTRRRGSLALTLNNLLVKAHWFPFLPANKSNYNVHVGLDVGGKYNDKIVSAIGHGFSDPFYGMYFKAVEVHTSKRKAEPINPDFLCSGLTSLFEETIDGLNGESGFYDRVLFFRDGQMLGEKDEWNEIDALKNLLAEAKRRNWATENSIWTVVEIMKAAEGWRVFAQNGHIQNPTVGYACFPFKSLNEGILCTTGLPYLRQGTAAPLKFRVHNISGVANRNEIAKEIVWEADLCFTKPDMGQSIPWILNIADAGALQLSRQYKISGIPA